MKTINAKTLVAVYIYIYIYIYIYTLYLVNKLENKIKHQNKIAIA